MIACVAAGLLWASRAHLRLTLPYATGVLVMMLGGALAAVVSDAPLRTGLVLAQDVLLLVWAATVALGRYDPAVVRYATHAWCRTAVVYSGVVVIAYLIGFSPLSGVTARDGVRAAYTFGDPNLAGNYLVVSLFVMAAAKRPRSGVVRVLGYLVVLVAIAFTGSNGAVLTLVLGTLVCFPLSRYRAEGARAGLLALVVAALLGVLTVGVVLPRVSLDEVRAKAAGSVPLLRDSIGRSGGSTSERAQILEEGYRLYLSGDATGFGPSLTKTALEKHQAAYVKEAHNDYLATLIERGVLGAVGLILLGFAIAFRCVRLLVEPVPRRLLDALPRAWILAVILPVVGVAAGFYEVLHFRHVWTWLGVLAAVALMAQDDRESG
jgi:O-antigen ligase